MPGSTEAMGIEDAILLSLEYITFSINVFLFLLLLFSFSLMQFILVPAVRASKHFKMYNTAH